MNDALAVVQIVLPIVFTFLQGFLGKIYSDVRKDLTSQGTSITEIKNKQKEFEESLETWTQSLNKMVSDMKSVGMQMQQITIIQKAVQAESTRAMSKVMDLEKDNVQIKGDYGKVILILKQLAAKKNP